MKFKGKILSMFLVVCFTTGLLPVFSFAAAECKALQFGTDVISGYDSDTEKYDYIYYGTFEQDSTNEGTEPIKWRVLDMQGNVLGGNGATYKYGDNTVSGKENAIFLMSDDLLDNIQFDDTTNDAWKNSLAQKWCKDFSGEEGDAVADAFTANELDSILSVTKKDNGRESLTSLTPVPFEALSNEKVFFISLEEIVSEKYGFSSANNLIASLKGTAADWWIRSRSYTGSNLIGYVSKTGSASSGIKSMSEKAGARPTFNLYRDSVLFTSAADNSGHNRSLAALPDYNGNEWKLTLKDKNNFSDGASVSGTTDLTVDYSSASFKITHKALSKISSDYTNVTAILTDYAGNILYYGSINDSTSSTESTVTIPDGLTDGTYTLSIYGEDWNGEKVTDYATGTPYKFNFRVIEPAENPELISPFDIRGWSSVSGYQYIYYGTFEQDSKEEGAEPIKWRVLDVNGNATGKTDSLSDGTNKVNNSDSILMLSEKLLGTGTDGGVNFREIPDTSNGREVYNSWQNSNAQDWCKDFAGENGASDNITDAFTAGELGAVLQTTKSDAEVTYTGSDTPETFSASDNILNNDKVFFLSVEEASAIDKYGFVDNDSRLAKYNGFYNIYWLRSPRKNSAKSVGIVKINGMISYRILPDKIYPARPAFNLNKNDVIFASPAENGKNSSGMDKGLTLLQDYTGNEWKLTIKDSAYDKFKAEPIFKNGDVMSVSYSGAKTGKNEYISAIIKDADGSITHYGRIKKATDIADEKGQIDINLSGINMTDKTLYIFNEQCNGDKKNDYSSELNEITSSDINLKGDENSPYLISNIETLKFIRDKVNSGNDYSGLYFKVTADIDLGGEENLWTPIGNEVNPFNGNLDGGGHKITGLYINGDTSNYQGLFGCIGTNGSVKNIGVDGKVTGADYVGGLCGYNKGTIQNSYSTCNITGTSNYGSVCGASGGTVQNSYYLAESETDTINGTEFKTSTDFTTGVVTYLLNGNQSEIIWGQMLSGENVDLSPVSKNNKNVVYMENANYHNHLSGFCDICQIYVISKPEQIDGVYQISNEAELYWFADYINKVEQGASAKLTDNIVVNEKTFSLDTNGASLYDGSAVTSANIRKWILIGNSTNEYNGTFDGNNKTISGLYCDENNAGLFGYIGNSGKVFNLGIENSIFGEQSDIAGGIAVQNSGTIDNCYFTGIVKGNGSETEENGIGCISAFNKGNIKNCFAFGKMYNANSNLGNAIAKNYSGGTVTNCYYSEDKCGFSDSNAVNKTVEDFEGGAVTYFLNHNDGIDDDVWGQTLTGENTNTLPVFINDSTEKVYKVNFVVKDNETEGSFKEYVAIYVNPNSTVTLPTNPTVEDGYVFYKWSTSQSDFKNAENDFTADTVITDDITVYAVKEEKYGATDDKKEIIVDFGEAKIQDLSDYTKFKGETSSSGKFSYKIIKGMINGFYLTDAMLSLFGNLIQGDMLMIPDTLSAGTYKLTITATEKKPEVSLMAYDTKPFTFDVTLIINGQKSEKPQITIDYENESLTGFDTDYNYTIDEKDVTLSNGAISADDYIGETISIVRKAGNNFADSEPQSLTIPARPKAPTGILTTTTSDTDINDGTITNVDSTMEYRAESADTWLPITEQQITGLATGKYEVRYKSTQTQFASVSAKVTVSVDGKRKITFVNYNNDVLQSEKVEVDSIPQYSGQTPTKPSDDMYTYSFAGWEPEITAVTKITTYTAKFNSIPKEYNVTLNLNGGTIENADNYKKYLYGKGLLLPIPTRDNYYFVGWYDNENLEGTAVTTVSTTDIGNKTYYAKWKKEALSEYIITFANYDNTVLQSAMVAVGQKPQYNGETPTRPNDDKYSYTFTGWSPEITEVKGVTIYTAQFARTPLVYAVEFTDEGKANVLVPKSGIYALIFTAYDSKGALTGIEWKNIRFDAVGEKEFEPKTLNTNGAVKIKVMLWNSINVMKSLCDSAEMKLQ